MLPHPNGGTFVLHAVERLRPFCQEVCVAGRFSSTVDVPVLNDPVAHRGPIVGILQALKFADERGDAACLVTPVDMPYLSSGDLLNLQDAWRKHKQLCCVRSYPDKRLQPLLAAYPVNLAESIAKHATTNRSLVAWLETQTPIEVPISESVCRNINTPADLK